jgi:hypothetical protein
LSGRAALIGVFIAGPILIPPAVVGRLVQVTILVRAAGAATRRRLVAASAGRTTLATAADIDTELGHGLAVDLASDFKSIAPLKLRERVAGLRSQSAVDLEHEAFFDKDHLDLADFLDTETADSHRAATHATSIELHVRLSNRNCRYDATTAVHDEDFILSNEIKMTAPLRMNVDQDTRNFHDPDARWHHGADTY